jgi:hypothetical protein
MSLSHRCSIMAAAYVAQSIMPVCMTECSGMGDFLMLPAGDLAGGVRVFGVFAFISLCTIMA